MSLLNFNLPVYNNPKTKQRSICVFYLLAVMFTPLPICWKRCINPRFALLCSGVSVCASVCGVNQTGGLCFISVLKIRGRSASPTPSPAQHYSQSLLGSFLKRDTFFYPRNQTGMTHSN